MPGPLRSPRLRAVLACAVTAAGVALPLSIVAACSSAETSIPDVVEPLPDAGATTSDATAAHPITVGSGPVDASTTSITDATYASDSYAAPHPAFPQILDFGGPILTSPKLVILDWDDYPYEAEIEELLSRIGSSSYWQTVTGEYGIGPATYVKRVSLGASAPKTSYADDAIQQLVSDAFDGGAPGIGDPDSNTVYVVLFSPKTSISLQGAVSCTQIGGFHESTIAGTTPVPFAVEPTCAHIDTAAGTITGIDAVTGPLSHELIEAVTDPFPLNTPNGYSNPADEYLGWSMAASGGELADMCTNDPEQFIRDEELSLDAGKVGPPLVERSWSNARIASGADPCIPAPPDVAFYQSMPVVTDLLPVDFGGTKGVTSLAGVQMGTTGKTIDVDLFSDRPTGDWTVKAFELEDGTQPDNHLSFSFAGGTVDDAGAALATGNNGTVLKLTITPTDQADPDTVYTFWLASSQSNDAGQVVSGHYAYGVAVAD